MIAPEPIEFFYTQPMNVDRFRVNLSMESIKENRRLKMCKSERTKEDNLKVLDQLLENGGKND